MNLDERDDLVADTEEPLREEIEQLRSQLAEAQQQLHECEQALLVAKDRLERECARATEADRG